MVLVFYSPFHEFCYFVFQIFFLQEILANVMHFKFISFFFLLELITRSINPIVNIVNIFFFSFKALPFTILCTISIEGFWIICHELFEFINPPIRILLADTQGSYIYIYLLVRLISQVGNEIIYHSFAACIVTWWVSNKWFLNYVPFVNLFSIVCYFSCFHLPIFFRFEGIREKEF